jgi:hypothetical protein
MDILYFLEQRTAFIRYYHDTAAGAFLEIQRKIEAEEPPFDDPPYDESGEPPFLEEWSDAARGVVITGRTCVSMLSGAMQLYFKAWERDLGITMDGEDKKHFSKGILNGYRYMFEYFCKVPWSDSGVNLEMLEQVTLARNTDQHGGDLTTIHARYPDAVKAKHKKLFFVSETERKSQEMPEHEGLFFFGHVEAPRDTLFEAIDELERLARWLEPQLIALYQGVRK